MTTADTLERTSPGGDGGVDVISEVVARWPVAQPFVVVGSVSVVAGGFVAAASRPLEFELGSWTAAFLVLVAGVAQIVLGLGQAWLAEDPPPVTRIRAELMLWNLGAAATIVGTLAETPIVTTVAGVALIPALALFITTTKASTQRRRRARAVFVTVAGFVLVSIPVGLALAWIRHA